MRKLCGAILLVLATASASQAQIREDDQLPPPILTPVAVPHGETQTAKRKVTDVKFWVVAGALNTAMVLDTQSTFAVSKRCPDCYEADPFVAGVVAKGAPATFVAGEAFDIALMTVAAKMKGSDTPWVRHTWWVMPVALTVGHAIAFRHNNALAR
jgi:hypothetical protein